MKPQLDGRAWTGIAEAYGTAFLIELFESKKHPGFYHYAAHCLDDRFCEETIDPIAVNPLPSASKPLIMVVLESALSKHHGLLMSDLHWEQSIPEQLLLSGERAIAGE